MTRVCIAGIWTGQIRPTYVAAHALRLKQHSVDSSNIHCAANWRLFINRKRRLALPAPPGLNSTGQLAAKETKTDYRVRGYGIRARKSRPCIFVARPYACRIHVSRVYTQHDLLSGQVQRDDIGRAVSLGFYGPRSGDLLILPEPYYLFEAARTSTERHTITTHMCP